MFGHYREISDLGLNVLTSLSLGQYIKASVRDFPVMTSLSVNKYYTLFKMNFQITEMIIAYLKSLHYVHDCIFKFKLYTKETIAVCIFKLNH